MMQVTTFISFFSGLFRQRNIFLTLVFRDFQSKYMSTYLGLPWAFIQPAIYVLVIWFAFSYGLRAGSLEDGTPFVPWLMSGLIPWLFLSSTMYSSCNSLSEYSYLITKTKFNVSFIPLVKIFSGMIIHLILMFFIFLLWFFFFDIRPNLYWIQWIYYSFCMITLLAGISWLVASIHVFVTDVIHLVNIAVTIFFWSTPIIWSYSMLSGNYRYIALLNPFFYITEGYRHTFVEQKWFFEFPEMFVYFWSVTLGILIMGVYTFQKLKRDFGDVL